ncbi:MAG: hypothetical protein ACUZ8N_07570 [Candidatus Scalindua sp.]
MPLIVCFTDNYYKRVGVFCKTKDKIHRSPDKKRPCPSGRRGGHSMKNHEKRHWTQISPDKRRRGQDAENTEVKDKREED